MPVKIDPLIAEELAAVDLVIWEAKHPKVPFFNEKTGKESQREQKDWVVVTISGPGAPDAPGGGPTLRAAVNSALVHSGLAERFTGLRGAMLRLERAAWDASRTMAEQRFKEEYGDDCDDIPF